MALQGKVEDPELLDHKLSLSGSTTSDIVGELRLTQRYSWSQ